MNCSKHSKRGHKIRSRASNKKRMPTGLYGTTTHKVPLVWEGLGMAKQICRNYFERIVEDPESLFECWITWSIDGCSWINNSLKITHCGKPDVSSKRRWWHVQYIAESFGEAGGKILQSLLARQIRKKKTGTKFGSWWYIAERWLLTKLVANGKNIWPWYWCKNWCT